MEVQPIRSYAIDLTLDTPLILPFSLFKLNHQRVPYEVPAPHYFLKIISAPLPAVLFQANTGTAVLLENNVPTAHVWSSAIVYFILLKVICNTKPIIFAWLEL